MPRAGDPGRTQDALHLRLVPHVVRGGLTHAGDAERVPDLGERHLELLEGTDQALDRTELGAEAAHGVGDLLWVQGVGDLPVRGDVLLELRRQVLGRDGGDQSEPYPWKPGGGVHEPRGGLEQERRDEGGNDHGHGPYAARARGTSHEAASLRGQ